MRINTDQDLHYAFERLLAQLRAHPTDEELIAAVSETGKLIEKFKDNLLNGVPEFEKILKSKGIIQNHVGELRIVYRRHRGFWTRLFVRNVGSSKTTIKKPDVEYLSRMYRNISLIYKDIEPEMNHDYADAFHGLSVAILDPKLDHQSYHRRYFKPFIEKWRPYIQIEFQKSIENWITEIDDDTDQRFREFMSLMVKDNHLIYVGGSYRNDFEATWRRVVDSVEVKDILRQMLFIPGDVPDVRGLNIVRILDYLKGQLKDDPLKLFDDVVVGKAVITEVKIVRDSEGPTYIVRYQYGPENRYVGRIEAGYDSYHTQLNGWSSEALDNYWKAYTTIPCHFRSSDPNQHCIYQP